MASYSDPFTGSSASLGANWTQITGATFGNYLNSNKAYPSNSTGSHGSYWNAGAFANDQYSEIVVGQTPGGTFDSLGLAVRISAAGENYYYTWNPLGKIEIWKNVGGTFSAVDQTVTSTVQAGDVLRLEAEGTTLRVIHNGSTIITKTDTSLSSGSAGIYGYCNLYTDCSADSWAGGDLGAAPAGQPTIKRFGGVPHMRRGHQSTW